MVSWQRPPAAWLCIQAVGQLSYIRPYVTDFSPEWLASSSLALVAGAMGLIYIAGELSNEQALSKQEKPQLLSCATLRLRS